MSGFLNTFCERIMNPNIVDVILNYNSRQKKFIKHIFIEGNDDIKFYSSFIHKKINVDKEQIGYLNCGGKKNVINSLEYFINNKYRINNCYFIVDKDYDSQYNNPNINSKLSTTKYYSIENYCFTPKNLSKIFDAFKFQDVEKELYQESFDKYINNIIDFEAIMFIKQNYGLKIGLEFEELEQNFYISNFIPCFNEIFTNKIKKIISEFDEKEFKLFYRKNEDLKKNFLLIRGHDLELFFDLIMMDFSINTTLNNILTNKEINKDFEIEIILK